MSRCQQHRAGPGLAEAVHVEAVVVDGNWHSVQASPAGDDVVLAGPGILQRDLLDAALCQRGEDEAQPLAETRHDDSVLGDRAARPDAPVVGSDNLSQMPRTSRLLDTQLGGRQGPRRLRHRPTPGGQRRRAEIGDAVLEVGYGRRGRRGRGRNDAGRFPSGPAGRHGGHPRPGADRRLDVPLGQQLLVDIDDRAPRDAEEFGQASSRRQTLAGAEASFADGCPQLVLDLSTQRTSTTIQSHQKVGATAGPFHRHGTTVAKWSTQGPGKWTFRLDRISRTFHA